MNNYIEPNWPAPKNVKAFTTKRTGGISKPPYESFNFSLRTGDDPDNVLANRKKLCLELNLPTEPFWLNQQHTNIPIHLKQTTETYPSSLGIRLGGKERETGVHFPCMTVSNDTANNAENQNAMGIEPIADAAFTTAPNLVCVTMTADCVPILVCDYAGTIVAAIHAGWKGIAAGVIEATIKAMNIDGAKLLAWLGPAIGANSFEAGEDMREIFTKHDPKSQKAFVAYKDRFLANIYLLASERLNNAGVTAIYGGEYCTFIQKELFFSFRRDGVASGRIASLIWLTD
jgi:YfiH family protein